MRTDGTDTGKDGRRRGGECMTGVRERMRAIAEAHEMCEFADMYEEEAPFIAIAIEMAGTLMSVLVLEGNGTVEAGNVYDMDEELFQRYRVTPGMFYEDECRVNGVTIARDAAAVGN